MPSVFAPSPLSLPAWNASSVCYALAYAVGLLVFALMARHRGIATGGVGAVSIAGLLGGLIGANAAQWFVSGSAGKTVLGGIVGGYLAVLLYKRYLGLRRPTGDLFAVALCAGEAVGRWGCFFGGCCYGHPAPGLPWSVFQHDAYRHPTQIYLSLACFAILAVLLWLEFGVPEKRRLPENGLFYVQGAIYCIARFVVEFYREGTLLGASWLTTAQWACLGGLAFFGTRLYHSLRASQEQRIRAASTPSAS